MLVYINFNNVEAVELIHLASKVIKFNSNIQQSQNKAGICNQIKLSITKYKIPQKIIEYILNICQYKNFQVGTFQLTLSILSRYLHKTNNSSNQSIQLLSLVSLFIASKVNESLLMTIAELHHFSNHSYTNKCKNLIQVEVYKHQHSILVSINFEVLGEGIADNYLKMVLLLLKEILWDQNYEILLQLTEDLQKYIWSYIYHGDSLTIHENQVKSLCVAIINVSFVLATQHSGRFPYSVWMCKIASITQTQLSNLTEKLLRVILRKQLFKTLTLNF